MTQSISTAAPLRNEITKSPDFWSTLQRLHQHKTEAEKVFEILTILSSPSPSNEGHDQALTADNFESAISLANDFATAGSIGSIQEKRRDFAHKQGRKAKDAKPEDIALVARANKAVTLIYTLTERVPSLIAHSHLERAEAWAAYWSPIFRALATQCVNPCREIRYRALSALQRTLLSEAVADEGQKHSEWTAIFDEVLFPLTLRLLKPEVYQSDSAGMNETRAQMGGLLCKVFLRYLDRLAAIGTVEENDDDHTQERAIEKKNKDEANPDTTTQPQSPSTSHHKRSKMAEIYIKTLALLDRLMNAGTIDPKSQSTDALAEAVREGVKNVLLVMDGAGYLHRHSLSSGPRPSSSDETNAGEFDIWTETVRRLERFLPGLVGELFPVEEEHPQGKSEARGSETGDGAGNSGHTVGGDENRKPGDERPQTREGADKK